MLRPETGYMRGQSSVRSRYREKAEELVKLEKLVEPQVAFRIVEIEKIEGDKILVVGEWLEAPRLIPESGKLTHIAAGVSTLGWKITERCTSLFDERKASLAIALDALAGELLMDTGRKLQDRIFKQVRKMGLSIGTELHAGDNGLALEAQHQVMRLADAQKIGVAVSSGLLLTPLKSGSVIFGVGEDLPVSTWSRCDDCKSRPKCPYVQKIENSK